MIRKFLRKIKWKTNKALNLLVFRNQIIKIRSLKDTAKNKSIFLVGNAPSLKHLDLSLLINNEVDFATVNCGFRIFPNSKPNYHFVADRERFSNFQDEILSCNAEIIFLRNNFPNIDKTYVDNRVFHIPYTNGGLKKRGYHYDISTGIGNDSSVLLFAAQTLIYLGYRNIIIIGCDLSYDPKQKYAYKMSQDDLEHEQNKITQMKRLDMMNGNEEFKILQNHAKRYGVKFYNAGHEGNLTSLERINILHAYKLCKNQ
ncbi:6-hydroxymethylpterin diphosphokinase MptE-like protein [Nitrincola schmidtii]|uniref:6-hydroxymethylpterin diphosphokinase MptE-like protein n=1 Tax=Nitrincola schmidtii TaxID=1730894 RepID=UPI00124D527A|nr:6-hydroxymethylpterin diphosphokinase MptE-like protein [Nitrincola schmidtii]